MNNVVKKGILLAAGLLLAGCGDNYWLLNNSGQDAQVNGNTVKNGRCIELEDSFWGSDFDEKVSVGGTAYELDPGHHTWSGSGTPVQVTEEKAIEALDEKCKAEPQPAGTPPAGTPPAEQPPAGTPPAGTPPAGTPPAGTPPAAEVECTAEYVVQQVACTKVQYVPTSDATTTDSKTLEVKLVKGADSLSNEEKQACLKKYELNAVYSVYSKEGNKSLCADTENVCSITIENWKAALADEGYTC